MKALGTSIQIVGSIWVGLPDQTGRNARVAQDIQLLGRKRCRPHPADFRPRTLEPKVGYKAEMSASYQDTRRNVTLS